LQLGKNNVDSETHPDMIKLLTDKEGWQFAVLKTDTHLARWSEEQRSLVTDPTVHQTIIPHLNKGDTVIDAGTSIGDHTVPYAKAVGPTGRVLAFEPYLPAFVCLTVNCRDLPQVELHHKILSNEHSLRELTPNINAGATHVSNHASNGGTLVETITLDSLNLTACHFIKLDIEGYEPLFIQGAIETIKKFRPKIFVELNDSALARYGFQKKDILEPLLALGYEIQFLDASHNLEMKQIDIFLMLPGQMLLFGATMPKNWHKWVNKMNPSVRKMLAADNFTEILASEARAILIREIEEGNRESRLFLEWLDASERYSRARDALKKYRSRQRPWIFSLAAWRARSQKKRSSKQVDSLRRQIESFFSETEARQNDG